MLQPTRRERGIPGRPAATAWRWIIDVSREGALFKSNAVRSCVELHEVELTRFYEVWERFRASGTPLPRTDDPSYESAQHLGGHVFRAARGYLTWIGGVREPAGHGRGSGHRRG
jgi:hypothetical protein